MRIGLLVLAAGLLGCASGDKPAPSWEGVTTQRDVRTQQAQSVHAALMPVDCSTPLHCPVLGLQWSEHKPLQAVLTVGFAQGEHPPVDMVEFAARPYGPTRIRTLAAEQPSTPGLRAFQVPMQTLERLATSHGVLITVHAGGKEYEEVFATGAQSSPAANSLKRWLQQIYKGTDKEQSLGLRGIFAEPYQR